MLRPFLLGEPSPIMKKAERTADRVPPLLSHGWRGRLATIHARCWLAAVVGLCAQVTAAWGQIAADPPPDQSYNRFLAELRSEPGEAATAESAGPAESAGLVPTPLTLADVIASLYRAYPEVLRARQQPNLAAGELVSAQGAFDTKFEAHSLSEPTGFYENYRHGLGLARQTWWGGYVAAGYRVGRGVFQPWYLERETEKAGEFKVGLGQALLQGRAIDPQRVAVFQASIAQQAAQPVILQSILDSSRDAAMAYWQWVASGGVLQAQRELLTIAEKRNEQYEVGVKAGKFAEIDLILNQQLIAERRATLLVDEQKFLANALKLGLYLRNDAGQPLVPSASWLPKRFPTIQPPPPSSLQEDLTAALARRPEPLLLQLELRQVQLDYRLAHNDTLPRVDMVAEASQDMGQAGSKSDDKGEFELVVGFLGEVPIQRRKARGKIQSSLAKMAQVNEKLRLVRDKIATELQIAHNALTLSAQIVEQSELSLVAALETLERYRFAFEKGKIDLIYLNLLETKVTEAEIKLIDAQRDWFAALADMQLALGLDPLDQALAVAELPPSQMPGPGNLPALNPPDAERLDQDWQLHTQPR